MAEVRGRSLTKIFKGRHGHVVALDRIDIDLADGEFVVFLGPSGSGKTTFLRLVAGLEVPTDGRVYIGDRDVTTLHPRERKVAMVFQDYALYPHMTVRENLSFGLVNLKYPAREIEGRVARVADMLGIGALLDRRPRELSGGQRQRVAVGRAVVRRPEVFLFDEPLSNLDAKLRGQVRVELGQLHQQLGTTTIYVTHDQVEAMTLGQRVVLLNHGVIEQVGTGSDLYNHPRTLFVAEFIGSPPMNLLTGEFVPDGNGALSFRVGARGLDVPPAIADSYRPVIGRKVVLGLRPHHVGVATDSSSAPDRCTVRVTPTVVERLGEYTLLHTELEGNRLTAKVDPDVACRAGEEVELALHLTKMRLFDASSGQAIEVPASDTAPGLRGPQEKAAYVG
jgi:multiple sugar transport system ATP-binding protein